jgi:hypothetical protein
LIWHLAWRYRLTIAVTVFAAALAPLGLRLVDSAVR